MRRKYRINNKYYQGMGHHRMVVAYRESFKQLEYGSKFGIYGVFSSNSFYPMEDVFLAEEGTEFKVKAILDTELARKVYNINILAEPTNYLIIKE